MSYIVWKVKQVNIKPLGSWLRWQGRGTQNSLPSASTSKTHLHVGPFSLKRNWRLAERLLNTQGFKQGPWVGREEGRKTHQVGIYGPGRGIRGKGRSPGQRPALGSQQFQPSMGYPSPGILHREAESPGWLGGGWDDEGVWGNLEWHLGGAEAAQGTQQGSLEPDGSQPTPPTHAKSPRGPSCSTAGRGRRGLESGLGGGNDQLWGTREIWTWDCVPWERVTIAGPGQAVRRRQPEPLSAADTSKGPPCFITTPRPHSGGSVPVLGQGKHALKGNGVSSVPTLRASAPATWDRLCPSRAGMAPEQRGDPTSHWLQF